MKPRLESPPWDKKDLRNEERLLNTINPAGTAIDQTRLSTRIERKFFIRPEKIGMAHALLSQICRPDSEYPDNYINSLYFDTSDLEQYRFSESGELRKNKVRIRWYDQVKGESMPVYLELKSREGFAGSKQRHRLIVPSEKLNIERLPEGIIERSLLTSTLAGFSYFPPRPLIPVVYIYYRRYRFSELSTATRVSLDFAIYGQAIAHQIGGPKRKITLAGGVVEIKGRQMELPLALRRLKILDTEWTRFSKYGNCLDACLHDPGNMAGYWPSGRPNLT